MTKSTPMCYYDNAKTRFNFPGIPGRKGKIMKKLIIFLLIAAMLCTGLLACRKDTPDDTTAPPGTGDAAATGTSDTMGGSDTTGSADITGAPGTSDGTIGSDTTGTSDITGTPDTTGEPGTTSGTDTSAESSSDTTTGGSTTTAAGTTAPTTTTSASTDGPKDPSYVTFDSTNIKTYMTNPNQCSVSTVKDATEGYVVKLTTTKAGNDPNVTFNYKGYMGKYGLTPVSADTYKYVILKVRCENCSNSSFELFYFSGSATGAAPGMSQTTVFNNAATGWQYIYWDLSKASSWKGSVNGFRFDFMFSCAAAGEAMYIASVSFVKAESDLKDIVSSGPTGSGLTAAQQAKVDKLLATADPAPTVSNTRQTAANEDSSINLWFNHTYTKTPAESTTSTGMYTYQMRLAKNEAEDCQFLLAATSNKTGLTAEMTDFRDSKGNVLKSEIYYGYYFDDVDGQTIADPIPLLEGSFDLTAKRSKLFLIRVRSYTDTVAGQYTATLSIRDSAGKEVKKAIVYAYVWDFALPEETSCRTQMDLSWFNIYTAEYCFNGDDGVLYKQYYDLLLENRVCAYNLPYNQRGEFGSGCVEYLNNPRVVAFNPAGWKVDISADSVSKIYSYLKTKQSWLDKAVFYVVDEPQNKTQLDNVINAGKILKANFPNYQMTVPMHLNSALDSSSTVDYFEYIKEYVNVWCPHTFFYNTFTDYSANHKLTYRCTAMLEKNLGTFPDRMAKEQKGGDEVWWYVTRYPESPEITLTIDTPAVNYRILFWQQKLYNVDGFLYYSVNDWYDCHPLHEDTYGWNSKHETESGGITPYDVYGNGTLVYYGNYIGKQGPVGSLRLECVRDGIEDYEYLTMLTKIYGEETVDCIIKQITTSLGEYQSDEALFTRLRVALGNLLDAN